MTLKIKNKFNDSIDKNTLRDFEIKIGNSLPTDYKKFLLKDNGGRPNLNNFRTVNNDFESDIQFFFGFTKNKEYDLNYKNEFLQNRIPNGFIAIANDSLGNYILLDLNKGGMVFFFDHETENTYLISYSFNDFIKNLFKLNEDESELDKAVSSQNLNFFKNIINSGVYIDDIVNEFNQPIVIIASLRNKFKLLEYFINDGAKYEGALFNASSNGYVRIVKYLLSKGSNPNERDKDQNNDTALIQACFGGHLEVVKTLIKNGADINATDEFNQTALNKAYWSNNQKLIDYLEKEVYN